MRLKIAKVVPGPVVLRRIAAEAEAVRAVSMKEPVNLIVSGDLVENAGNHASFYAFWRQCQ